MASLRDGRKLQALVYDFLPLEEGAGKRCSECETDPVSNYYDNTGPGIIIMLPPIGQSGATSGSSGCA